ncbi:membrane-flanked domain [Shewanella halifaxensis HAW-EB4]|uniref:Membrane-flanked domain n=1 Tax=Shewanella halifaxensis (strain HAW-EB4) TaxID=458817 RepID=B0TSL5_SHEHH|nr:PH domain-containing protein [Shewanella halifaxensis]ABZ77969.1 membrane-flanked domain [Shewanella halifaxensis HAW-EB4]
MNSETDNSKQANAKQLACEQAVSESAPSSPVMPEQMAHSQVKPTNVQQVLTEQESITPTVKELELTASHVTVDSSDWQSFDRVALQSVNDSHYTQVLTESLIFGGLVFIGASLAVIIPGALSLPLVIAILTGLLLIICIIGYLRHRHAKSLGYATCEHELLMQQGFWWVKRTSLPYSRLQHVSVSHGPLERHFNLSTIKCFSAGSGSAEIELPGIEQETAEHLRQHLLSQAAKANLQANLPKHAQNLSQQEITEGVSSDGA